MGCLDSAAAEADEIHVHLLARNEPCAQAICRDLQAALGASGSAVACRRLRPELPGQVLKTAVMNAHVAEMGESIAHIVGAAA